MGRVRLRGELEAADENHRKEHGAQVTIVMAAMTRRRLLCAMLAPSFYGRLAQPKTTLSSLA
jgi:hypothetical protein